jgi:hypothetical protein
MHDFKGTGKRALGEEPEKDDCESSVAEFTEVTGAGVDEAAAATPAAVAGQEPRDVCAGGSSQGQQMLYPYPMTPGSCQAMQGYPPHHLRKVH